MGAIHRVGQQVTQGGGAALAARAGAPLLAEIPFEEPVVAGQDRGAPPVLERPGSAVARAFESLAEGILGGLGFANVPEDEEQGVFAG